MNRFNNSRGYCNTRGKKKYRLKKSVKETMIAVSIGLIGALLMVLMIFGAALQEQDKLSDMTMSEVVR